MTVLISDGEIAADGLIIGNRDIEAVMLVVDLVDEIVEHRCGEQYRHGEIRPVGDNPHARIDEVTKLKRGYLVKRPFGHASQTTKLDGIHYLGCVQLVKACLAVHPYGVYCARVDHGIKVVKTSQPDYWTLIFFYQFQRHLSHSSPHPQMSTWP